jgi:hypothetical protein
MIIRALGAYNNFKLAGKPEPESILIQRKKCIHLLNTLKLLTPDPEIDFFEAYLVPYFLE